MNDEYLKKLSAEIESTIPDDCIYYSNPYDSDAILYAVQKAWQAALEYKRGEYSNIVDAMTRTSQNNAKLLAENKKLREALEFYAMNGLAKVEVGTRIDERLANEFYVNGIYAREVLKEVGEE